MPVSNDNQDYGEKDNKNKSNSVSQKGKSSSESVSSDDEGKMTSDNLKGKKVDADIERETDKPADV
jgi:hypothetical protein